MQIKKALATFAIMLLSILVPLAVTAKTNGCVTGQLDSTVEGNCITRNYYTYCSGGTYVTWSETTCY